MKEIIFTFFFLKSCKKGKFRTKVSGKHTSTGVYSNFQSNFPSVYKFVAVKSLPCFMKKLSLSKRGSAAQIKKSQFR